MALGPMACRPGGPTPNPADHLRPKRPLPNLIFVMIDTLRADKTGACGHPGNLSPTLDEIAAKGVLFDRVIAASSWTQPSMASLFTSRYPGAHRVILNVHGRSPADRQRPAFPVLHDAFLTLAEALQSAGYATAGVVANPLLQEKFGFAQGFDHDDISFAGNQTPGNVINAANASKRWPTPIDRPLPPDQSH